MGLFRTREPRRFNLPPIYWDERKERLRKIKERALDNEDKDPHRMQDITERLISQKRKTNRKSSMYSFSFSISAWICLLILLFVLGIFLF